MLRTADPTSGNVVLDLISLDYSHTLMAASGHASESALHAAMKENFGKYLLLVTGSVPLNDDGIYLTIGGRTTREMLEESAKGAAAVTAIGACAHYGGVQAAGPQPDRCGRRAEVRDRTGRPAAPLPGIEAAVIGRVVSEHAGMVSISTIICGSRVVDLLRGDQLPRIC